MLLGSATASQAAAERSAAAKATADAAAAVANARPPTVTLGLDSVDFINDEGAFLFGGSGSQGKVLFTAFA